MFIKIDEEQEQLDGFSYSNAHGGIEVVKMEKAWVVFEDDYAAQVSEIYYADIPKLIKALQMAYDYKMKENK